MPSLGMHGPYDLTVGKVEEIVKPYVPGVFAIGYTRESGAFVVQYIGRSDRDVRAELMAQPMDETTRFKWVEMPSQRVAFETQCRLYHDFGESRVLENENHPERPAGANWPCPVCDVYGR